jgi:hypothetical protein
MMGEMVDKLFGLETRRSDADKSFGTLLQRASNTSIDLGLVAVRLECLDARPAPPPL